jgi:hypothetical protein
MDRMMASPYVAPPLGASFLEVCIGRVRPVVGLLEKQCYFSRIDNGEFRRRGTVES